MELILRDPAECLSVTRYKYVYLMQVEAFGSKRVAERVK